MSKNNYWRAVGRRKSSVARLIATKGTGKIIINKRDLNDYFSRSSIIKVLMQPIELVDEKKLDFNIKVEGGGLSGQAGAIRLAIARVLQIINPDLRTIIKQEGMLTRDSREVERKKYGQPGARKKFQFSKR